MVAEQDTGIERSAGAIILAAGAARRAGVTKQLLLLDGNPLLQHVVDNVLGSSAADGVLVLGHEARAIREAVDPGRLSVVVNEDYAAGQASSLIAGLRALPEELHAAIVLLGDQPGVDSTVIDRVIARWRESGASIVASTWQGERGNPVLFSRSLFPEICQLSGDTGARAVFGNHSNDIEAVEFDRPMPIDIDTLDDYCLLTQIQER